VTRRYDVLLYDIRGVAKLLGVVEATSSMQALDTAGRVYGHMLTNRSFLMCPERAVSSWDYVLYPEI
jgi:hypothetical protein